MPESKPKSDHQLRHRLHEIIFEADTPAGKLFDVILILSIVISVIVVMLDSVADLNVQYGQLFVFLEWFFTIIFTAEYVLRLSCMPEVSTGLSTCYQFFPLMSAYSCPVVNSFSSSVS